MDNGQQQLENRHTFFSCRSIGSARVDSTGQAFLMLRRTK
jgi:hypothetical protein